MHLSDLIGIAYQCHPCSHFQLVSYSMLWVGMTTARDKPQAVPLATVLYPRRERVGQR
jgi:hypothetical protein